MQNLGPFQTHLEIKQQIFVYYNWMKNDKVLILEFSPNGRVEESTLHIQNKRNIHVCTFESLVWKGVVL